MRGYEGHEINRGISHVREMVAIAVFDIDGVVRDVGNSYRRALADTVEHFTQGAYRPSQLDIDALKAEGIWNNDWEASQELTYRYYESQGRPRATATTEPEVGISLDYEEMVQFFQSRYRGTDPINWNGYICQEPLLLEADYLASLSAAGIGWGFFSGATRGSATYVLEKRLGLQSPVLIAMEDAPGKPDPTGLLQTVQLVENGLAVPPPVLYVGDTVADIYTVDQARQRQPNRTWVGVGVLPPHTQDASDRRLSYTETLKAAGAQVVLGNVQELTPDLIRALLEQTLRL